MTCDLIVHCKHSNCRLNYKNSFVNLDSVLKCNKMPVMHIKYISARAIVHCKLYCDIFSLFYSVKGTQWVN